MKFLEVLVVWFGFHFGLVVALSLEAVETSDHLGFYQPSCESDHLQKPTFVEGSTLCSSLYKTSKKIVLKV